MRIDESTRMNVADFVFVYRSNRQIKELVKIMYLLTYLLYKLTIMRPRESSRAYLKNNFIILHSKFLITIGIAELFLK